MRLVEILPSYTVSFLRQTRQTNPVPCVFVSRRIVICAVRCMPLLGTRSYFVYNKVEPSLRRRTQPARQPGKERVLQSSLDELPAELVT
jgi:hypothetical protein